MPDKTTEKLTNLQIIAQQILNEKIPLDRIQGYYRDMNYHMDKMITKLGIIKQYMENHQWKIELSIQAEFIKTYCEDTTEEINLIRETFSIYNEQGDIQRILPYLFEELRYKSISIDTINKYAYQLNEARKLINLEILPGKQINQKQPIQDKFTLTYTEETRKEEEQKTD